MKNNNAQHYGYLRKYKTIKFCEMLKVGFYFKGGVACSYHSEVMYESNQLTYEITPSFVRLYI